jgi:hypothetical protein
MKDLVVKRVAMVESEATFHPKILERSRQLLPENRQKVWQRELPHKN